MISFMIVLDGDDIDGKISMGVMPRAKERTAIETKVADELDAILQAWWNDRDAIQSGAEIAKEDPKRIYENPEIVAEFMISFMRNNNKLEELKEAWVKQLSGKSFKEVKKPIKLEVVKGESNEQ